METIMTENGTVQAIVVKEDKKLVKRMWDGIVDTKVMVNKVLIKGIPISCVVASVFAPEAAIVLLPTALFFQSKTGKKFLNFAMNSEEVSGEFWKGNFEEASNRVEEAAQEFIDSDVDVKEVMDDLGLPGGASHDR